ncbi:MAG TPA: SRPBCC family protein [Vicinamibacterales bacterium]
MPYLLTTRTVIPRPLPEVFAFFAEAANLDRITPPWLRFRIETPMPIALAPGTTIDYRLRLNGIPVRWRTEITEWNPPYGFVDEQRRGPYRWWIHAHRFRPHEEGTEIEDEVDYSPRGGALIHALFVAPRLRRIFRYRDAAIRDALGVPPAPPPVVSICRR